MQEGKNLSKQRTDEGSRIYRSEAIWFEPSTGTTKARMNKLENSLADINIKISAKETKLERTLKKSYMALKLK